MPTAETLQLYKQAAALDDPRALIAILASIYENGRLEMRENPKLAYKYYEQLQQAGNPLGYFHLGRCYDAGIGVSPDALKSTQMFLKAALTGVTQAQVVMARRYYDGQGLETDPVSAALGWLPGPRSRVPRRQWSCWGNDTKPATYLRRISQYGRATLTCRREKRRSYRTVFTWPSCTSTGKVHNPTRCELTCYWKRAGTSQSQSSFRSVVTTAHTRAGCRRQEKNRGRQRQVAS